MQIGDLSQKTGVSKDTLRFYEKQGLIRAERRNNGYRDFDPAMVRLVGLIKLGQKLGFTLVEIKEVVDTISKRNLNEAEIATLLSQKLEQVEMNIAQMRNMQTLLQTTLGQGCPLRQ